MKWPYSESAEQNIIGALILDPQIAPLVFEKITKDDFFVGKNAEIFEAAANLYKNGEVIDLITLSEKTANKAGYLMEISGNVVSAANISSHIDLVKEKSLLRQLGRVAVKIGNGVSESEKSFNDLLAESETDIYKLSRDVYEQGLKKGSNIAQEAKKIQELRQMGGLVGIKTGINALDSHLGGFQKSDLIILAGRPSMGKTALGLTIANHVAKSSPVAFFSLEMGAVQLFNRIAAMEGPLSTGRIFNGQLTRPEFDRYLKVCEAFDSQLYIDDSPNKGINQIISQCRRMSASIGLSLVVIDYIGLMATTRGMQNRDQALGEISRGLKGLAKELDIPVLLLSQLNRSLESREDKRPLMSDLRESGNIEQDADIVLMCYRDWVYNNNKSPFDAEIIIRKFRNGSVGTIPATFIGTRTQWVDFDEAYNFKKTD